MPILALILESTIDLGDRTAPMTARVNRRARRLIVRVDAVKGRVLVTAPSKRALPEALAFARTRAHWIRRQLTENASAKPFRDGAVFPLRGAPVLIAREGAARMGVRLVGHQLLAGGEDAHLNRRIVDWLRAQAAKTLTERVDHHAAALGKKRGPIAIRDMRSRWGSCGRDGAMSFSWRLILAPPFVLDCVAAHECAHLVHLDHSPAFWRVVKGLGVDARAAHAWFSEHGRALHAHGVEA